MRKTVREWLHELPEEEKAQAFKNIENQSNTDVLSYFRNLLSDAINAAFCWTDSSEGFDYWSEIYKRHKDEEDNTKQKIYICGPISNMPEFNKPLFSKVEQALIEQGFKPINPHNLCAHHVKELDGEQLWQACMKTDIAQLVDCDILLLLPNWQNSRGAKIERNLAHDLGIPVKYLSDFDISI